MALKTQLIRGHVTVDFFFFCLKFIINSIIEPMHRFMAMSLRALNAVMVILPDLINYLSIMLSCITIFRFVFLFTVIDLLVQPVSDHWHDKDIRNWYFASCCLRALTTQVSLRYL